ncbi:MAG: hypothetical protein AABW51_02700 [Nanoarchaeota archaeon]
MWEKRLKLLIICSFLLLFVFTLQIQSALSNNDSNPTKRLPNPDRGGGSMPAIMTELTENGNSYNMKSGGLEFSMNGKRYIVQTSRVKDEYANFSVLSLNTESLEKNQIDTSDANFTLRLNEIKNIDLDNDNADDISVRLNSISATGRYKSIRSANFIIKKIGGGK